MTGADPSQPAEPWTELRAQAQALAEQLRTVAQDQPPAPSATCLSYAEIVEDLARVAASGGAAPTVRRLGSLMTPGQMQAFGSLLRDRRNQAGLSRVQLGRKAKLSDATVKFLETARHPPSRATVLRLLAVPELKLSWADVPAAAVTSREPAGDAAAQALLAALQRLDPRLTSEAVCELSVLADELCRHQELIESTDYGCRRGCRLCGARSEGAAMDAHQARKLPLRHAPLCAGQLAAALLQKHPALSELATVERHRPRTATAQALSDGTRLAALQRFYGVRSGPELAAQLAQNAALPQSPYRRGVGAVLMWALGLGPGPLEPAEPFSEQSAQRLAVRIKLSDAQPAGLEARVKKPDAQPADLAARVNQPDMQPAELRERVRGLAAAVAWLLDEQATPGSAVPDLPSEAATPPPDARPVKRGRAQHG